MVLKRMKNLKILFRCLYSQSDVYIYFLKRIFCSLLFWKSFQFTSSLQIFSTNGVAQLSCLIREATVTKQELTTDLSALNKCHCHAPSQMGHLNYPFPRFRHHHSRRDKVCKIRKLERTGVKQCLLDMPGWLPSWAHSGCLYKGPQIKPINILAWNGKEFMNSHP